MKRHIHIPEECQEWAFCDKALKELRQRTYNPNDFVFELPKERSYKTILNPLGKVFFGKKYRY